MLANELDVYRGKENKYIDNNIKEIQELYKNEEIKKEEGRVEDKKVILVRPYKVSITTLSLQASFIMDEVKNLLKYMKFLQSLIQTRLFKLLPHY